MALRVAAICSLLWMVPMAMALELVLLPYHREERITVKLYTEVHHDPIFWAGVEPSYPPQLHDLVGKYIHC